MAPPEIKTRTRLRFKDDGTYVVPSSEEWDYYVEDPEVAKTILDARNEHENAQYVKLLEGLGKGWVQITTKDEAQGIYTRNNQLAGFRKGCSIYHFNNSMKNLDDFNQYKWREDTKDYHSSRKGTVTVTHRGTNSKMLKPNEFEMLPIKWGDINVCIGTEIEVMNWKKEYVTIKRTEIKTFNVFTRETFRQGWINRKSKVKKVDKSNDDCDWCLNQITKGQAKSRYINEDGNTFWACRGCYQYYMVGHNLLEVGQWKTYLPALHKKRKGTGGFTKRDHQPYEEIDEVSFDYQGDAKVKCSCCAGDFPQNKSLMMTNFKPTKLWCCGVCVTTHENLWNNKIWAPLKHRNYKGEQTQVVLQAVEDDTPVEEVTDSEPESESESETGTMEEDDEGGAEGGAFEEKCEACHKTFAEGEVANIGVCMGQEVPVCQTCSEDAEKLQNVDGNPIEPQF